MSEMRAAFALVNRNRSSLAGRVFPLLVGVLWPRRMRPSSAWRRCRTRGEIGMWVHAAFVSGAGELLGLVVVFRVPRFGLNFPVGLMGR